MSHDEPQEVLSYHSPEGGRPDPLKAMLLCLPAMICWVLFFGVITGLSRLPRSLYVPALFLWILGIGTAIYSFFVYYRKPKPWYVMLALTLNWLGIIFTISPLGWISIMILAGGNQF